jgi:hypothetical protein
MMLSIDAIHDETIYIHEWDGEGPEYIVAPPESKRAGTLMIGNVEIVLFRKGREEDGKK